ncbi:hypothetical protein MNB_SV-4-827 [hydrothermal vent metagenome]|uniref:Prepilin-type N-terminal cleavage/methylation domain-containing protein n=1 Tax=hydrothermal vent metagenome TaxID=652676 RepID=A0A1W1E976_9ZZZZ
MRKGFSLLELLLVIFIVSMVYFLGFEGLQKPKSLTAVLTPNTLKPTLLKSGLFEQGGIFLCTNQCSTCYYKSAWETTFKPYEGKVALKDAKTYFLNRQKELEERDYGRFQDQKICLIIQFYPNKSTTPIILEHADRLYLIPSYLGKSRTFNSLGDLKHFLTEDAKILQNGDFY